MVLHIWPHLTFDYLFVYHAFRIAINIENTSVNVNVYGINYTLVFSTYLYSILINWQSSVVDYNGLFFKIFVEVLKC